MPLPFALPQRPSMPSLSWALGNNNNNNNAPSDRDGGRLDGGPKTAPLRASSQSSIRTHFRQLSSSSRHIKHTSITVSRPTTPASSSPVSSTFGLPANEEDDPFGVLALEKAGLLIKEAGTGTNVRPGSDAFQYRPAPSSPIWRSSVVSAASRASRPSFEGRSSILTGRRSIAHSRQASSGTIATTDTPFDLDALEKTSTSMSGISPTRGASDSRRSSPEDTSKRVRDNSNKSLSSLKPDSIPSGDADSHGHDEVPSPRMKLPVVDEDAQEDVGKEETVTVLDAKAQDIIDEFESDLDRLARELREMAEEHEEEQRKSQESESQRVEYGSTITLQHLNDTTTVVEDSQSSTTSLLTDKLEQVREPNPTNKIIQVSHNKAHDMAGTGLPTTITHADTLEEEHARDTGSKPGLEIEAEVDTENEDDQEHDEDDDDEEYDSFDDEEEPVIVEAAVQTAAPLNVRPRNLGVASLQARAQIVSVHLPPPPKVPSRNPRRARQAEESVMSSPGSVSDGLMTPSLIVDNDNDNEFDNETNSSYSLSRDSFDDGHDIMTQTSQGSDAGSPQATPTRAKMFDTISSRIDTTFNKSPISNSDGTDNTQDKPEDPVLKAIEVLNVHEDRPADSQLTSGEEKPDPSMLPPTIASETRDNRRPFSFETTHTHSDENQDDDQLIDLSPAEKAKEEPNSPEESKSADRLLTKAKTHDKLEPSKEMQTVDDDEEDFS